VKNPKFPMWRRRRGKIRLLRPLGGRRDRTLIFPASLHGDGKSHLLRRPRRRHLELDMTLMIPVSVGRAANQNLLRRLRRRDLDMDTIQMTRSSEARSIAKRIRRSRCPRRLPAAT